MTSTIEKIETILLVIPFSHPGPPTGFGGTIWSKAPYLLVRVTTSDGIVGWGEAFGYNAIPATRSALEEIVAPLALGKDSTDIGSLMTGLERPLHLFGRSGPVQYALSGLDIALWDIAGKRAGCSVAQLLGGGSRQSAPAYTSLLKAGDTNSLKTVCEFVAKQGFDAVKLHETDPALAVLAREVLGPDTALMLDVNCAWDVLAAQQAAKALQAAKLTWLEEPVWPPEDLAGLNRVAGIGPPLAAGENIANPISFDAPARSSGLDFLQPSVTKVGGISAFMQVGQMARLAGKRLAPHSPYFGPGYLATLQMASVFPEIQWVEHFGMTLEAPIFGGAETPDADGIITLPKGPGLGFDPDPAVLNDYAQ